MDAGPLWSPRQVFADYILRGITAGFHIGADRSVLSLQKSPGNMPSTRQLPHLVREHIHEEMAAGRVLGPLPAHLSPLCHSSPIGLIPKPHQPGKWRLIVDLSSPHGHSVNDAISYDTCHMHYASVFDAADLVLQLGRGALLAKMDLHHAYRVLPVHADDHPLPFGLWSAPKIFLAFANALAWVLGQEGIQGQLHYLDDFLFIGPPSSPQCKKALLTALQVCKRLGV